MKRYLLLLLVCCGFHAAQAQLLNKLKERATNAVQSAGSGMPKIGGKAGQAAADKAVSTASQATEQQSIIFSKEPFREGQTTGTATDFGPTDNIYARVLLGRTIQEALEEHGKEDQPSVMMQVGLTTDVQEGFQTVTRYNYCSVVIPKADFKKKYFDLDVLPALNHITTRYVGQGNSKDHISTVFNYFGAEAPSPRFPFGKRRFKLEFGEGLVGYFDMTVNNWKEKKPLDARIAAIRNGVDNAVAKDTKLPAVFRTGGGKFSDPQLSTANIRRLLGSSVLKIAIEPGNVDYNVNKNALGVPVDKVTRPIWTVYKDDDGNCYFKKCYLIRKYEGGGKYGPLDVAATTAEEVQIACENVK